MIHVYVWNFQGKNIAWGHASMDVNGTYISWWPMKNNIRTSKFSDNIYSVHPIRNRTFKEDKKSEGGGIEKEPDHFIPIKGLNENKILQWWGTTALVYNNIEHQGPIQLPWSTLGWNCARIVATGLKTGGGDTYADFVSSSNLIWTPYDVQKYATKISQKLAKLNPHVG